MSDDNLLRIERILSHSNKESRPPNFCENFKFCLWSPWNWAYIQKTPWNCAFFRDLGCFLELRRKLRVSREFMQKHLDFILDNWKSCMHQVKYTWRSVITNNIPMNGNSFFSQHDVSCGPAEANKWSKSKHWIQCVWQKLFCLLIYKSKTQQVSKNNSARCFWTTQTKFYQNKMAAKMFNDRLLAVTFKIPEYSI